MEWEQLESKYGDSEGSLSFAKMNTVDHFGSLFWHIAK